MKSTRKLIPALAMLIVAAVVMSTASYAWFSMNTQVTATGMNVTVKSDNTYLLISKAQSTAAGIQSEGRDDMTTIAMAGANTLYPAAPALTTTQAGFLTTTGKDVDGATITTAGVQVKNAATAAVVTNWFTATAAANNAATMLDGSARQLKAFTGYVDIQTVYLTVAVGANNAENLTVTPTFSQNGAPESNKGDLTAVKALIVTSDGGYAEINSTTTGSVDIKGSNTALTDATVITVTAYIYVDGDAANVYTNNKANLTGVKLDLKLNVTAVAAA